MTYVKNPTWQDHPSTATPVTAAALNHMEDGIAAAGGQSAIHSVARHRWPGGGGLPYYYDGYAQIAPMVLQRPMSFDELTVNVTTLGTTVRVGFWRLTGDPSAAGSFALLAQVPFDAATTGRKTVTGLSITLPAGPVWVGATANGGARMEQGGYAPSDPYPVRTSESGWGWGSVGMIIATGDASSLFGATTGPWNDSNTDPGCVVVWFGGVTVA